MRKFLIYISVIALAIQLSCTAVENFKVHSQVSGPGETNSYLIYGVKSKKAALIDPGGPIDTLIQIIKENNLSVKYIFITHGHIDHIFGVPDLKRSYPEAKLCMNKVEYQDIFTALKWVIDNYGMEWIESVRSNPETSKLLDFDMNSIGIPDIYADEGQIFKLGYLEIKTICSPGHSPGAICYYTDNILFSGDVLLRRSVGRTDSQHGSRDDQIKSVRRLYNTFPDSTIVYTGHRKFTDIGSEKRENKYITLEGGLWSSK